MSGRPRRVGRMTSIMWFRRDLRLRDHPALQAAAAHGPVLGLFVLDPALWRGAGSARRAWLAASLRSLDESIGGRLCVRIGPAASVVPRMAAQVERRPAARDERLLAVRPGSRHRGREGPPRLRRGRGDRHALRRRAGLGRERVRQSLQGVHAVQQGLAGARLGRPDPRSPWRRVGSVSTTTSGCRRCSTRRCVKRPRGCRRRARTPRCAGSGAFSTATSTTTTRPATTPGPTAPRGSRRTSSTACSTLASCSRETADRRSAGSVDVRDRAGVARLLRRRALPPPVLGVAGPEHRRRADVRRAAGRDRGLEAPAPPASRSSTPGCASSSARAGCTTGCG